MYLLEKLHLVQFYLFSAETLYFGKSSAIVAPNGSGKSAVLDALQIVLHGGDQNAIDLNAQSGGKKGGRSIREYLLGYYLEKENVRDYATSFLTLVFRDSTGKHPVVSAGISLGAAKDEPKHRVYGMYLAPGVELRLEHHVEVTHGEQLPVDWVRFKEIVRQAARDRAGSGQDKPVFFDKASEFVEALLFQLRPDRSRGIDHGAFSKALKNALNLKDVHDASAFVREQIIEARPINVAEFRHQLESFRELRERVRQVKERIDAGTGVEATTVRAIAARMRKASYAALSADLERDIAFEKMDEAQDRQVAATIAYEEAKRRKETTETVFNDANRRLGDLLERARHDPSLKGRDMQAGRERALMPLKKNLATDLRRVVNAYHQARDRDTGSTAWSMIAKPWQMLLDRIAGAGAATSLGVDVQYEISQLTGTLGVLQPMLTELKQRESADRNRLEEAKRLFTTAVTQLERARRGKSQIPDSVVIVQNRLADVGIIATPVSDLVRITDASWAPAIEAYLRTNAYALIVDKGREDEAIHVYESIPDSANPFGVKIVQPKNYTVDVEGLPATALARLIVGENDLAVGFLRSRLRRLLQLESANSRSLDGLTRKGILVSNGTIERLRLPAMDQVSLGKQDLRAKIDFLTRERMRISQEVTEAERDLLKTSQLMEVTAPLASLKDVLANVERWLSEHATQEQEFEEREAAELNDDNPDLQAFHAQMQAISDQANAAKKARDEALHASGMAEQASLTATSALTELSAEVDVCARKAAVAMQAPYVDAGWIDDMRSKWENQGKSIGDMLQTCASGKDRDTKAAGELESDVRTQIQAYASQYNLELTCNPSDPEDVQNFLRAYINHLRESELVTYERQAEEAYGVAVRTFRSRIAASLRSSFDDMFEQLRQLNRLMASLPPFTNDERYKFKYGHTPEYRQLYDFIVKVAERSGDDDLFNDPVNTPEEFRSLVEDVDGPHQQLLEDYRRFFWFDVVVIGGQGNEIATLKTRMEKGSGGEHRAPLFVVAGAALAAAYGKLQGDTSGMSLILFDELGDKIDGNNTKAVFEYLSSLGLQPIVAAPDDALGKINESIIGYVELYRDGSYLSVNHVGLGPAAVELLSSDDFVKYPHLLEAETRRVIEARGDET
ncbi:SbcC/MukB-like Walker B domain-containing protein [Xanthomonas cerealis]|nr:SbcC/MukB-like Walker B domain-containing protein [Xanthomonas translucens]